MFSISSPQKVKFQKSNITEVARERYEDNNEYNYKNNYICEDEALICTIQIRVYC